MNDNAIQFLKEQGVDFITSEVLDFFEQCVKAVCLYAKKNHDYGNSFAKGCDEIGLPYAVGRLYDKMNRLVNLVKNKPAIADEKIEDTVTDLGCYAFMLDAYLHNHSNIN